MITIDIDTAPPTDAEATPTKLRAIFPSGTITITPAPPSDVIFALADARLVFPGAHLLSDRGREVCRTALREATDAMRVKRGQHINDLNRALAHPLARVPLLRWIVRWWAYRRYTTQDSATITAHYLYVNSVLWQLLAREGNTP